MIYRHKSSVQVLSDFATAAVGQGIAHETSAGGAVCVSRLMLAVSDSINKLVIHAVPFLLNILLIYLICCIVSNIPRILLFPIYQQRFVSNSKLDVGKLTFSVATPNKSSIISVSLFSHLPLQPSFEKFKGCHQVIFV